MRNLLLPMGLIGCGILASLPFRRTQPQHSDSPAALLAGNLPTSVAPLCVSGDGPSTSRAMLDGLRPIVADEPPVAAPRLDEFPSSYDQVAVPLAGRDEPSNLLSSQPRARSRWGFDRFGIPRPSEELNPSEPLNERSVAGSPAGVNTGATAGGDHAESPGFGVEQPLGDSQSSLLVRASEQKRRSESIPAIGATHQTPTQQANRNKTRQSLQSPVAELAKSFGPHSETHQQLQSVAEQTEIRIHDGGGNTPPTTSVEPPAERVRHWIHEPTVPR